MKIKDVINAEGIKINTVVVDDDNNILFTDFILSKDEKIIDICDNFNLIIPKWDGTKWIESATKDEIKEYNFKIENRIY